MQRPRPTRAGGRPRAATGREPSTARRVVRSPDRLQQPSGEANVSPPHIFPRTLTAVPHDTLPANNNRMEERLMSCHQQQAPPQCDAAKMSPRISIRLELVLAAHAPSQPAAGRHCPAREGSAPLISFPASLYVHLFTTHRTSHLFGCSLLLNYVAQPSSSPTGWM